MATTFIDQAIQELTTTFRGSLITPATPEYEEARLVRNGLIDRHPVVIARCSGAADVVAAVNFARDNDLLVSIRGGGHNVAGSAVNDGGIVIDLSGMRAVNVDPVARTARVQGGATWADVDRETQLFGLATPGGLVSSTGVGGLTLGGGFGWLRRKYGYSVDNVLSVEIVTADGQIQTASESENPELFWAVRGAGSNFGVVTSFEFRLHEVGPTVAFVACFYDLDDGPAVLPAWRDFMDGASDDVSSNVAFWAIPGVDAFPAELHGKAILAAIAFHSGDVEEGLRVLQPLRELATPVLDLSGPWPYTGVQSGFDPFFPKGGLYYWKSTYLDALEDTTIDQILAYANDRPSPMSLMVLWHMKGGAASLVPEREMAFSRRSAPYLLSFDSCWTEPEDTERSIRWTRDAWADMRRHSDGSLYLNFAGFGEEKDELVRAGYGDNYDRLVTLKTQYDPGNLFRMNQNIRPRS